MTPLQEALLAWSDRSRRDLPWRGTRDPWAILVSELMLQQTQVSRAAPRFCSFLERFPTPAACAAAPLGDVLREWAGLGYNRRAVHLHAAARTCVDRHQGTVPRDLGALLALPGVGGYTARAVLAFAYGLDVGVVDTNAARVLARVGGRRLGPREAQDAADSMVPAGAGWAWNQAVLDLGATVCTKRAPRCAGCPVAPWCVWQRSGCSAPDPAEGSAGTSRPQSRFAGSDRQGRGRLLAALMKGSLDVDGIPQAAGWPDEHARAHRVAAALVAEGFAVTGPDGRLSLP